MNLRLAAVDMRPRTVGGGLVTFTLILGLLIAPIAGVLIAYIALAITLAATIYLFAIRQPEVWSIETMGVVFAAGFTLLAMCFAISARAPGDLLFALNFLTFLLYVPLFSLLTRAASPTATDAVAWLAFAGTLLGACYSVGEVWITGADRAGWLMPQNDPIRVANTTLLLGFFCLIGLRRHNNGLRLWLWAGPALGLAATIACGSRTAMVAFAVLLFWVVLWFVQGWKRRAQICAALGLALTVAVAVGINVSDRLDSLILSIHEILTNAPLTDPSMDIRMSLYRAATEAFGDAPVFGHGWAGMMRAIEPHLPAIHADQASLPHLHNEILNFALAAGIVGVMVLAAILATPMILALRSTSDSQKTARIYGCSILILGYLVLGTADTMLSYETHTSLFVIWTAILLGFCRDRPNTGDEPADLDSFTPKPSFRPQP